MPPPVRRHGEIRHWVARRLGLKRLAIARSTPCDALAVIAGHHGLETPGQAAREASGHGLEALCLEALSLGLSSRLVRLEAASLHRLQLPCLVQHEHLGWMPLVAVHEDHVTLQHPQQGRLHLQREAWAMEFKGLALEFRRGR